MKKNFRNMIDLTFWDKDGHSAFGLKRGQAKILALFFITIAFLLVNPIPDPTDFLNIVIANFFVSLSFSANTSLILTYSIIPLTLFLIGIWIYPHNTQSLFNGYVNKTKKFLGKYTNNPLVLGIVIIIIYYVFNYYKKILGGI